MSEFYKNWDASKSQNNNGAVPFYRPIDLTPEEKEQACKNIGVASNDAIERLEGEFTDLRGDMAVVEGNVNTALTAVNDAVTAANDALSAANAALSQVSTVITNVDAISAKADNNSANISVLSGKVDTNIANIASLSGKNTAQDNRLDVLDNKVAGLTNNFNTYSAKVDTNVSNISTISAAEANDRTDINTLSGNLNTVSNIATSARQEALEAKNTANATSAFCQNNYQNLTSGWSAMQNDWSAFSAAEDAVITAATAAIPGQVSAEVSGQLSGKQDKLTPGVNISLNTANVIDVANMGCSAGGYENVAIGFQTTAVGQRSFAHGYRSLVSGNWGHAEGYMTSAVNDQAHSEGVSTYAAGNGAHAEGYQTSAMTQRSHTEGYGTIASASWSHAEGYNTITNGQYSHAEGAGTTANNNFSHAEGRASITDTDYQHVEGQYNAPATGALHVIGNGTSTANRSNIVETYTDRVNVNGNLIASGVNIIENMNTMAALPSVYSGAQNIVISPDDRNNFTMTKNSALTGTNATFNYFNNELYVNMDTFQDGNNTVPRFNVAGSNKHCTIERFNIDADRVYSLFRGSSIIIDEIKEWGKYIVSGGYNYCPFYYVTVNKLPATWEGFSGWPNIASRMFESSTFKDIPSDYSTVHLPNTATNYNFSYMFQNNEQLSGGAVEFMDWVLAEESANNKTYTKTHCFYGCTAIPNYSALTADPTYSAFF